jgi:hypothetical protein
MASDAIVRIDQTFNMIVVIHLDFAREGQDSRYSLRVTSRLFRMLPPFRLSDPSDAFRCDLTKAANLSGASDMKWIRLVH